MTSLFIARRRAEEFAAALDGDAKASSALRADTRDLVGVATLLREHPAPAPREEFVSDLRTRLMLEAQTALTPEMATLRLPTRTQSGRERRLVAAASAVILIGGTTGVAAAAQSALPGDTLYPIKRGIERAETGLTLDAAGKGKHLLDQAEHRLAEVEGLLVSDSVRSGPQVPDTLLAFAQQATEGSQLLFDAYEETGDSDDIVQVRTFAADGLETLRALTDTVPADAKDELSVAAAVLNDIDREALRLCGACASDLPALDVPLHLLARSEVDRALQLAATTSLSNDHPVVVPKGTVKSGKGDGGSAPAPGTGVNPQPGDGTSTDSPNGAALPVPTPDSPTGAVKDILPSASVTVSGGAGGAVGGATGGKKSTGKAVEDVVNEVEDAVETLLPDIDPLP